MGNGEFPVEVVIMLSLHVSHEIVVWDNGIGLENDANGIFDSGPLDNNLWVVLVELTVDFINVAINCCIKKKQILKVILQSLSGGDRVTRRKLHDDFVHEWSILHPIEGVVIPVSR